MAQLSGYAIHLCSHLINTVRYTRRNRALDRAQVHHILIVKLDHIGDMILAMPVIPVLKSHFPQTKITMLAGSWSAPVLEGHPDIDEVIIYDSPRYIRQYPFALHSEKTKHIFDVLNSRPCDLMVSLSDDWGTLPYALFGRCRYRADLGSLRVKRKAARMFPRLCRRYAHLLSLHHATDMNLEVLRTIGLEGKKTLPAMPLRQGARESVERLFQEHGIQSHNLKVIVHPGAAWPSRAWGTEQYARVADHLVRRYAAHVIITGSSAEADLAARMAGLMSERSCNVAGSTTLQEFMALAARCHLFVGNDGGPMHMAAAAGIPVIAIFGPQDPEIFGPLGDAHCILYRKVGCSPCRQDTCRMEEGKRCLDLITVEEVIGCVDRLVQRMRRPHEGSRL